MILLATVSGLFAQAAVTLGIAAGLVGVAKLFGSDRWKENYQAERERGDRLEEALIEAHQRELELKGLLAKLEALPDLSRLLDALLASDKAATSRTEVAVGSILERVDARFSASERRASERHEQLLGLFKTIGHSLADLATQINERNGT